MTPNNQFLLLLEDVRIAPGASSETAFDQQVMQVNQRRHRKARRAPIAIPAQATGSSIHARHHRDHAGRRRDVNNPTGDMLLAVMLPDTTPIEGVPAIMDLDLLPDMGRMTGRLRSSQECPNALFAGHDLGAENWAVLGSLIESCKLHGVNPEA